VHVFLAKDLKIVTADDWQEKKSSKIIIYCMTFCSARHQNDLGTYHVQAIVAMLEKIYRSVKLTLIQDQFTLTGVAVIRPKTEDCPRTKNEDSNKTKSSTGIGPKKMRGAVTRPKNITGTGIGPKKKQ
jgi:hypothetical protein